MQRQSDDGEAGGNEIADGENEQHRDQRPNVREILPPERVGGGDPGEVEDRREEDEPGEHEGITDPGVVQRPPLRTAPGSSAPPPGEPEATGRNRGRQPEHVDRPERPPEREILRRTQGEETQPPTGHRGEALRVAGHGGPRGGLHPQELEKLRVEEEKNRDRHGPGGEVPARLPSESIDRQHHEGPGHHRDDEEIVRQHSGGAHQAEQHRDPRRTLTGDDPIPELEREEDEDGKEGVMAGLELDAHHGRGAEPHRRTGQPHQMASREAPAEAVDEPEGH